MPKADVSTLSPVDSLVLVRLLVSGEKGTKAADIAKAVAPMVAGRWSGVALSGVVDRSLIKLGTMGWVDQTPGRTKRAAPTFAPTVEGHKAALAVLNVDALPTQPKPTWASVKKTLLTSRALNLPGPEKAVGGDPGLRAILLDRQAELRLGGAPTLKQAKDAWTRKLLGMGPKEKITVETIVAALMRRELGEEKPATPQATLDRLLARGLGAPNAPIKDFRDKIIGLWVDEELGGRVDSEEAAPAVPSSFTALDLAPFARLAREAARRSKTGRYGDNKVFIVHVWRTLQNDPAFKNGDFPAFKKRLTEANNARLLSLARADLVQAMDPEDVLLSETTYMSTCFHFIRDDLEDEGGAS